jgi:ATP-binding cassette subfamily B protein
MKAWLFSGTIAQNLRDGDPDATDEELWHAVDVAQGAFVHELVRACSWVAGSTHLS